jgi:hypothetical protein
MLPGIKWYLKIQKHFDHLYLCQTVQGIDYSVTGLGI